MNTGLIPGLLHLGTKPGEFRPWWQLCRSPCCLFLLGIKRKARVGGPDCGGWSRRWPWRWGGYRMPVGLTMSSAAYGAAFGLFPISWIVFWAIVLYNMTVATGKFTIIKDSVGSLTPDLRIQAIIIAFGFGGFLEGAAGFGTPPSRGRAP